MKRPSHSIQLKVFSNLFEAFKNIDLDWKSKYAGFERVLLDSKLIDHWPIIGITYDALKDIAQNNFSRINKNVVRGHIKDRKDRAKYLFTHEFKNIEEAFDYFIKHDKVVLITKKENNAKYSPDNWSKIINIPEGIFPYRSGYSANYNEQTLSYLENLWNDEKNKNKGYEIKKGK